MLKVTVSFRGGHSEALSIRQFSSVGDLKKLAQKTFGQGFLRLVTANGHVLTNPEGSLLTAGIQEGAHITAVAQQPKVATTLTAFAVWCCGGDRIVTWGRSECGGDSSRVQDQLRNVQQVHGTCAAFAAILADGFVLTWGHPNFGGDCSAVQHQLKDVQQIQATNGAFAAILADGSVVTWGDPSCGGTSAVQTCLKNVLQIHAIPFAFAAIWRMD